jgi:hypothetical protein
VTSIAEIARMLEVVLTSAADGYARSTGFVQRRSKLTGALFAKTLVLGWLHNPMASLEGLTQTTASLGLRISPQGLDQRFTPQGAALLKEVLNAAVSEVVAATPVAIPILRRFTAVILQDSSTITLPAVLSDIWRGCGGNAGQGTAALKIQVQLDISNGTLYGPLLQDGRAQDHSSPLQTTPLPPRALRMSDLGYFKLDVLQDIHRQGAFFLSRLQAQTVVFDQDGNRLDLVKVLQQHTASQLDMIIHIGVAHRLPVRLLALRVPQDVANERRRRLNAEARHKGQTVSKARLALADWTIYVTNAPSELLSLPEALAMARVRWQIELLFKLWKQHGHVDESRSAKPWRILCEVYAKLTAMVIQHWLLLVSSWAYPDRSLVKAAQTVRSFIPMLASAMAGQVAVVTTIAQIRQCVAAGCRMNRRKKHPNTYQLLLDLPHAA